MRRWTTLIAALGAIWIAAAGSAQSIQLGNAPKAPTSDAFARSTPADALPAFQPHLAFDLRSGPVQDTLRKHIRGGEILIIALPGELEGRSVDKYALVRAPALSRLVDRSFMWQTLPADAGFHDVLIAAVADSVSMDTLVVSVTVD